MRLIDADKLLDQLDEIRLERGPKILDGQHKRERAQAVAEGISLAAQAAAQAEAVIDTGLSAYEQWILQRYRELYAKGRRDPHIHNPEALALYWTWRDTDLFGRPGMPPDKTAMR